MLRSMACLFRMVLPDIPHQITRRGNRCERTLFENGDYALYLNLLADAAERDIRGQYTYLRKTSVAGAKTTN